MIKFSESLKQYNLLIGFVLVIAIGVGGVLLRTKNTDNVAATDDSGAVDVVKQHLADMKNDFGVISFSVNSVKEVHNDQHTNNILENVNAVKMGLTKENIALVDAYVNVQYDGTKVPYNCGENQRIGFTLIREDKSKPWIIADYGQGMGGIPYIDFLNPQPERSAELYVWKNRELTGNDNTYFTVLDNDTNGINRNRSESEIYDLAFATNSIDSVNLRLAGIPNLTNLSICQMNTTDFTKQEMSDITNKVVINADNHTISIGLWEKGTKQ